MKVVLLLLCAFYIVMCRDLHYGMFKKNDFLVAQDQLYKERIPYRNVYAKYGRLFKCTITYIRVVDRLGIGHGPNIQLIRGGVRYKYLVLKITSVYNYPIAVNIYIGCENKVTTTRSTSTTKATASTKPPSDNTTTSDKVTTEHAPTGPTTNAGPTAHTAQTTDGGHTVTGGSTTISDHTGGVTTKAD